MTFGVQTIGYTRKTNAKVECRCCPPPSPPPLSLPQLDLAMRGALSIQAVHQSVSPRHSCFRIITEQDILYASCGSQEELHKWTTK